MIKKLIGIIVAVAVVVIIVVASPGFRGGPQRDLYGQPQH